MSDLRLPILSCCRTHCYFQFHFYWFQLFQSVYLFLHLGYKSYLDADYQAWRNASAIGVDGSGTGVYEVTARSVWFWYAFCRAAVVFTMSRFSTLRWMCNMKRLPIMQPTSSIFLIPMVFVCSALFYVRLTPVGSISGVCGMQFLAVENTLAVAQPSLCSPMWNNIQGFIFMELLSWTYL